MNLLKTLSVADLMADPPAPRHDPEFRTEWLQCHPSLSLWDITCEDCGCTCPPVLDLCTQCSDEGSDCLDDCLHRLIMEASSPHGWRDPTLRGRYLLQCFAREQGVCPVCSNQIDAYDALEAQLDHMVPLNNGGTNDPFNLYVLHKDCHRFKTKRESDLRKARNARIRKGRDVAARGARFSYPPSRGPVNANRRAQRLNQKASQR